MIFKCLPIGMLGSNCYILGNDGEGIVIDAGANSDNVMALVEKNALTIKSIILTHTHIDHICYVEELRKQTGAKVLVHELDARGLSDKLYNSADEYGVDKIFNIADSVLQNGDVLTVGDMKIEIIHTPGHTKGSICIKTGKILFTGDTLFRMAIGRTDFEGGSRVELDDSVINKLMKLEDDLVIYPGHGAPSTIGFEREHNPFIRYLHNNYY